MLRLPLLLLGLSLSLVAPACASTPAGLAGWSGPKTIAQIESPLIDEASGLTRSPQSAGVFWINNDSGGQPVLYAIDAQGKLLGAVRVAGVSNIDWEDVSSFTFDGRAYLLIADTGDNLVRRTDCALHIIAEPTLADLSPDRELTVPIAWTIPVRYPNGPHDCESVAVDPVEQVITLVSKRVAPPFVYRLPLAPPSSGTTTPVATLIGRLNGIPAPTGPLSLLKVPWGKYRAEPCALDFSPDGRTAVVLSYGEVYLYTRKPGLSWSDAFAGEPIVLASHGLPQAEAVCFTADGKSILVTTEGHPAPLLRYDLRQQP